MTPLQQAKMVARDKYAWPGGYPMFLVMADGGCLCPACVKAEWRQIVQYTLWNQPESGWMVLGQEINWENPDLYCDHCGERIESAYAEKEASA
jgi:hypothetical protein